MATTNAREHDVQVAERVMGWARRPGSAPWLTVEAASVEEVPAFTTDPAADYLVLTYVRSMWGGYDLARFELALSRIWLAREKEMRCASVLRYMAGDYARAALAVKMEQEQGGLA